MRPPSGCGRVPAPPRAFKADLARFRRKSRGRKKKQDKRRGRRWRLRPVTSARSAGSCGVLKGRCSAHEIVALTLFSVEFGCLLRVTKSCWGVPGLLRHEGPFKKCVAENKKLKKTFLHDFYSFFALFALIHIFFYNSFAALFPCAPHRSVAENVVKKDSRPLPITTIDKRWEILSVSAPCMDH